MLLIGTYLAWSYAVPILLYNVNSSFAPPAQHVSKNSELALCKLHVKLKEEYETLIRFFRPMTCRHKEEQTLTPCHMGEDLNKTECLQNKCCSSKTGQKLKCYMPLKDDTQQIFRLVMLAAGVFLILAGLPWFCSACLRRSRCVNPLQKANKEVEKVRKKRAHNDDTCIPLLENTKDRKNKKKRGTST